ncbi:M1 family metallopeptidase [soil metagenome]
MDVRRQVWTQGQGRYTSHWLPSFDDTREKVIFNLSYSFNDNYTVISNGVLEDIIQVNDSVNRWNFSMEKPMSSYLVAVAAGDYETQKFKTSTGIPVEHFYEPRDKQKLKWTYNHSLEIFEFLEKEIGVAYPWQNYKQIPVQDFLHSGMENTGATIFSSAFVIDSIGFNDRNYVNVNAHELAHQWFGNYVTAFDNEHHWLQEGFSTYYALLAEKQIFGENYYYWRLYESAEQLKALSDTGKGEALINLKAGSLTVYQKGAWALHILNELIGEKAFKTAVRDYLLQHAYGSVTTHDFLNAAENASGVDLSGYEAEWLRQSAFQGTAALSSLKQSAFIRNFMEVAALKEIPVINKMGQLENALSFPVNDYTGQEAVFQLSDAPITETIKLYRKAFESGNLYVRQAIALGMETIPKELKSDFISLLDDASYITIENALMKLWLQYPDETARWLAKTKGIEGLPNKNVKMLWLLINLVNPGGEREDLQKYYEELSSYTRPYHPFEVRQNAFGYLYQINTFSRENLIDLLQAGQHHNTRFRDYARKLLTELLKNEDYRLRYEELGVELNSKDRDFLNSRLKPLQIK